MTQPKIEGVGHGVPRMLYASDGSNWYAVLVDSDGHVKIDVVAYPGSNALGNFPFGYYDRYSESITATSTGAADTYAYGTAVPAGEVWIIESISFYHDEAASRASSIQVYDATRYAYLARNSALGQYTLLFWVGKVTLKAGDKVSIKVEALTSGKVITGVAWGYKMKIA